MNVNSLLLEKSIFWLQTTISAQTEGFFSPLLLLEPVVLAEINFLKYFCINFCVHFLLLTVIRVPYFCSISHRSFYINFPSRLVGLTCSSEDMVILTSLQPVTLCILSHITHGLSVLCNMTTKMSILYQNCLT
jgi:hypothetical protein